MNVLHIVAGDLSGGAAKGAYNLHLAQLDININSFIITNGKNYLKTKNIESLSDNFFVRAKLSFLTKVFNLKKLFYINKNKRIFSTGFDGIDITKHYLYKKADIINLHWVNGLLNISSIKNISKPIVWTIRDMWPMTGGCHYVMNNCKRFKKKCGYCPQLKSTKLNDLSNQVLQNKIMSYNKKNITIVGLSKWISSQAELSSVFKNFPIYTIGNYINSKQFYPLNKCFSKKKLKLPTNKKIITFGAQNVLDFYKGFDLFLEALKNVESKDFHILIFGKLNDSRINQFNHTSLGFISKISDLRTIYSASDLYVSSSRYESFGKSIAEALACGTPSVIFGQTGSEDIVSHKVDGYIATPYCSKDLAKGIDWILENKNNKNFLNLTVKKISKKFNSKKIANDYKKLYKKILKEN